MAKRKGGWPFPKGGQLRFPLEHLVSGQGTDPTMRSAWNPAQEPVDPAGEGIYLNRKGGKGRKDTSSPSSDETGRG